VLAFNPNPGSTDGTGATEEYLVTIRTNSNGPGTIDLGAADGTFDNIAAGAVPTINVDDIFLGSTMIDPTDGNGAQNLNDNDTVTFAVPNDGAEAVDGVINGLEENDIVYLTDGTNFFGPFTVGTVSDPLIGTGITAAPGSIELTNTSGGNLAFTPAAGWMIVESQTVTLTVTQGLITAPADPASWVTTVTATMVDQSGTGFVTTNAVSASLTVTKMVSTDSGVNFANSDNGAPEATLTYRITVTNNGSGLAKNVVITDPMTAFTSYVEDSAQVSSTLADIYGSLTTTPLTDEIDGDGYDYDETTPDTATYSLGDIAAGQSRLLFFQVTID
jgi:uncharacterized repeat protein (TIGR01451 family)